MKFCEKLNGYMTKLGCPAKDLRNISGISAARKERVETILKNDGAEVEISELSAEDFDENIPLDFSSAFCAEHCRPSPIPFNGTYERMRN